jgi:uncharacterized lipoprotein NlpE involved in copper resistance
MRKYSVITTVIFCTLMSFNTCKTAKVTAPQQPSPVYIGDNARNRIDWAGSYTGVLPCADCEGVETRVMLTADGTYVMSQKYLGRDTESFETKGTFQWSALGNTVTLTDARDKTLTHFAVAENQLTQLDRDSRVITGELAKNYILTKVNPLLVGKHWKPVELGGKLVESGRAYILLGADDSKVSGNLGCNDFVGEYELKTGNRLRFGKLVVTSKMCLSATVEDQLKEALNRADSYRATGDSLVLLRARMAPIAIFTAAE